MFLYFKHRSRLTWFFFRTNYPAFPPQRFLFWIIWHLNPHSLTHFHSKSIDIWNEFSYNRASESTPHFNSTVLPQAVLPLLNCWPPTCASYSSGVIFTRCYSQMLVCSQVCPIAILVHGKFTHSESYTSYIAAMPQAEFLDFLAPWEEEHI